MKVTVHGSGYVGLVTAACLASMGNDVLAVDIDSNRIERLKKGEVPIHEHGLEALVGQGIRRGRLRFTDNPVEGVQHGYVQFIAVGTPSDEDGSADLRHVLKVAITIAQHMDGPRVIVDKSTVPVGTADRVREQMEGVLGEDKREYWFDVVSNPEFLKEGSAVEDFMKPDRVIIGSREEDSIRVMRELYAPFMRQKDRMLVMSVRDAEFTKYAANAMLAARISLMNEFANIADHLGVDIEEVRKGIGSDPRIGPAFLYAGCGYGGSCFPKDVKALIRTAHSVGYRPEMLEATENVNNRQKEVLFEKINTYFNGELEGKTFAVWGLAFKPGTDDMREAPSIVLINALLAAGAKVQAYDPTAMSEAKKMFDGRERIEFGNQRDDVLKGADALVIVTEWSEFRSCDRESLEYLVSNRVVFDGRNALSLNRESCIRYIGIGRKNHRSPCAVK